MPALSHMNSPSRPRISYAQNCEDILLDRLFNGHLGTYVDVGAHHPTADSNTCFFYERGWHGVNLEPLPYLHRLLVQHRPRDLNLAVAASDTSGRLSFFEVPDCPGLSTLSAEVAEEHQRRGFRVVPGQVPCQPLSEIISEWRIAEPDLFSLDVEGHEAAVLARMPWSNWRPRVLVIEATLPMSTTESASRWESLVLRHGYLLAAFNGLNRFYLREDLRDRLDLFRFPVSTLDGFVRHETVLQQERIRELEARVRDLEGSRPSSCREIRL